MGPVSVKAGWKVENREEWRGWYYEGLRPRWTCVAWNLDVNLGLYSCRGGQKVGELVMCWLCGEGVQDSQPGRLWALVLERPRQLSLVKILLGLKLKVQTTRLQRPFHDTLRVALGIDVSMNLPYLLSCLVSHFTICNCSQAVT